MVHSHGHLGHRAGDPQFEGIGGVQWCLRTWLHVRKYFGFVDWPMAMCRSISATRLMDVLPRRATVRHDWCTTITNAAWCSSAIFCSRGDSLVDDWSAYQASARPVVELLEDRPVSFVLGRTHRKESVRGLLPWQFTYILMNGASNSQGRFGGAARGAGQIQWFLYGKPGGLSSRTACAY